MISAQCDELRKTADELDEKAKAYAPTAHNALSPMLRQAADTIWGLRCKLAGVVDQSEEIKRFEEENAKLRELVRLMDRRITPISPCKSIPCGECPVKDECDREDELMRELGIEVDG